MIDELLLLSGKDIPFTEAGLTIHVPKINEIGMVNEEKFLVGITFLNFSKNMLNKEDKSNLGDKTDFEIFMTIVNAKEQRQIRINIMFVLSLLFPEYQINIEQDKILLIKDSFKTSLNELNFNSFKEIINDTFCLDLFTGGGISGNEFNPADGYANKIAEKLQERHKKLNKIKNTNSKEEKGSIFGTYISILGVGLGIDINILFNYTIYQLVNQFYRYRMKMNWDELLQIRLAGGGDENTEMIDWRGKIKFDDENN